MLSSREYNLLSLIFLITINQGHLKKIVTEAPDIANGLLLPQSLDLTPILILHPLLLLLPHLQLHVLVDGDLGRPVHLEREQEGRSLLRFENDGFFGNDVEYGVIPHRLVHEWNVDLSWQPLVDLN